MRYEFGEAIPINNGKGKYGLAILSRAPMKFISKIFLPVPPDCEQRIFLIVKIMLPRPVYMIVTHFPYEKEMAHDREIRLQCVHALSEHIQKNHFFPAILVGDFNAFPDSEVMHSLRRDWDIWNDFRPEQQTCCVPLVKGRMIDYICSYPRRTFHLRDLRFGQDFTASDHCPVTADLTLDSISNI